MICKIFCYIVKLKNVKKSHTLYYTSINKEYMDIHTPKCLSNYILNGKIIDDFF